MRRRPSSFSLTRPRHSSSAAGRGLRVASVLVAIIAIAEKGGGGGATTEALSASPSPSACFLTHASSIPRRPSFASSASQRRLADGPSCVRPAKLLGPPPRRRGDCSIGARRGSYGVAPSSLSSHADEDAATTSSDPFATSATQPASYVPDPSYPYESTPLTTVLTHGLSVPHPTTHLSTGLSPDEATARLELVGPNSLEPPPKKTLWELWLSQFDDRLVQILLVVAFMSALFSASEVWTDLGGLEALQQAGGGGFGESSLFSSSGGQSSSSSSIVKSFLEPAIILAILMINASVGVWQDLSAAGSLEALEKMQPRLATVLRRGDSPASSGGDEEGVVGGNNNGSEDGDWVAGADASTLVPGDVIRLRVGARVPADARLASLMSSTVSLDESSLTGESVSVRKLPGDEGLPPTPPPPSSGAAPLEVAAAMPIQDQKGMVFSGTMVTGGSATAVVVRTGQDTQMGKIQASVVSAQQEERKTPLGEKLDEFGDALTVVIGAICAAVWVASYPRFSDPGFASAFEGGIYYSKVAVALGVAAIPEGLPAVITLCLALGTRRMAERNVIVRKLPSVETLGCTTVICTDKTGTLTTNQMTAVSLVLVEEGADGPGGDRASLVEHPVSGTSYVPFGSVEGVSKAEAGEQCPTGSVADACQIMALCNDARLIGLDDDEERSFGKEGEPTEAALLCLVEKLGPESEPDAPPSAVAGANVRSWQERWDRYATLEFDRERKSMSVLCARKDGHSEETRLFVKGAPNLLIRRCTHVKLRGGDVVPLTDELRRDIEDTISSLGGRPLRCLGLATREGPDLDQALLKENGNFNEQLADSSKFSSIESGLTFVGLVGIKDPARPGVAESISLCKKAGIRVIMITGDAKDTAVAIAKDVNIFTDEDLSDGAAPKAFEGKEFFMLPESEQLSLLRSGNIVFCRAEPADKQRLVKDLQALGEIPAMTGDGVNDAPALQQSSIGVAMGIAGTDVAKEAADMVLVDDNFSTIVDAVEEGRCIYANMQAFINFLISCNIGEVIAVFFATIFGFPQLFSAMQLLWVNLVTDGPPATALGFNPPDPNLMSQKPRPTDEEIMTPSLLIRYTVSGLYIGVATVGIYANYYISQGIPLSELGSWSKCTTTTCDALFSPSGLAMPQTLALATLVTIELLKALSTVSVDSSIFVVGPQKNPWLLLGVTVPFVLNLAIIYSENIGIPVVGESFGLVPLSGSDWINVILWSFPILLVDEILKAASRRSKQSLL